ncbi:MAG: dUTP diphosphatase [Candidatus Aminicenantaceae bacterium]
MEIKVKRIHNDAKLPCYGHVGDAGLDLFSVMECVLKGGEARAISTGIQVAIPDGYVGLIWDKSGISLKNIHRLAGVVDSGYRGEIKIVMTNLSTEAFSIEKGMKIAQMLIQPVIKVKVVDSEVLDETTRGENGFGSTGKY